MARWQVGIDIGGTFTDVVAYNAAARRIMSAKVQSFRGNPIRSLLSALDAIGLTWAEVDDLVHGTTIVTNAIVEGHLARVAFVATRGFADILAIGRQNRRHLYRLDLPPKLQPQVPSELCFEAHERLDHHGAVVEPLDEKGVAALVETIRAAGPEAVAVSLLHSYANPAHEQTLKERLTGVVAHVALSHEVNPEAREFERASTTALSAGVMPLVSTYIDRLEAERPPASRLHFFHSASGLCSPAVLRELPLALALSGPAAGVAAASRIARDLGLSRALTFDMGGTTTDVCLIIDGEAEINADRTLAGRPLRMPAVAVESIGAGGGSIVHVDGHTLRVGPESAGADPGPACYGLGGTQATVSDANMILGYLEDGATFGGDIRLSRILAEQALAPVAKTFSMDLAAAALGVVRVANNAMSNALRRVTVERGIDARDCALIAFGGAGPMHAVEVARLMDIRRVIVPQNSGAFSAFGCLSADLSYTIHRTVRFGSGIWNAERMLAVCEAMRDQVRNLVVAAQVALKYSWVAAVRYVGQSYAVEIGAPPLDAPEALGRAFKDKHRQLYGFATEEPWEVIALRLTGSVPGAAIGTSLAGSEAALSAPEKFRDCIFDTPSPIRVQEYQRANLARGCRIAGPAIISDAMSTIILPPRSSVVAVQEGHLDINVEAKA
jgi:N-methylhydantoinase A